MAYSRLTKRDRLMRHYGIASYLDRAKETPEADEGMVDIIARHSFEAARLSREIDAGAGRHDPDELAAMAVVWVSEAARRAENSAAWPTATRLFSQALDLMGDDPTAERFAVLLGRSRSRLEVRDFEGAREDGLAALGLAEALGDLRFRSQALVRLGVADVRAGRVARGDDALSEALELAENQGDTSARADALRQRGMAYLLVGDQRSAEAPIAAALEAFRADGDVRGEAWAQQNLAWIALSDGRADLAASHIAASIESFQEVGDRGGLAWARGLSAFVRLQQGDLVGAQEQSASILRESLRRGDRFGEGMMYVVQAAVQLWTGHPGAAITSVESALEALRSVGDVVGLEQALALAGRAEVMSGAVDRGRQLLAEAIGVTEATSTQFAEAVLFATEVQLGFPERVTSGVGDGSDQGHADSSGPGSPFLAQHLSSTALALVQQGRTSEALELARAVEDNDANGYTLSSLALIAAAAGSTDEARLATDAALALSSATYLDRTMAHLAVALSDPTPTGDAALAAAVKEISATEDVLTTTLVDLAGELRAELLNGGPPAPTSETEGRLGELRMTDSRWIAVFRRALERATGS